MLRITVDPQIEKMRAQMSRLEREQLPFATAVALTKTAKFVEAELRKEMGRVFDRPTRYTLNSLRTKPATKRSLFAEVKVKDESFKAAAPIKWLSPQIYGGPRGAKRSEDLLRQRGILLPGYFVVPGAGARLDSAGNISRGQMQQILSALGAQFDVYQRTSRGQKRNKATRQIFAIRNPGERLPPGVYQRVRAGVRPLLIFVRQPRYRKRLRFFEIADAVGRSRFRLEFALAMRRALATARARAA